MFSFLNTIPVVGHAKGLLHYVAGDARGGNAAMYSATRSTIVVASGAAGVVGGPAGMAAGAMAGGMATDLFVSALTHSPSGIVADIDDVANDFSFGSVLNLSLSVAGDAVSGIGLGGAVNSGVRALGESVGKNVVKEVAESVLKEEGKNIARTTVATAVIRTPQALAETGPYRTLPPGMYRRSYSRSAGTSNSANSRTSSKSQSSGSKENKSDKSQSKSKSTGTKTSANASSGAGSDPPKDNEKKSCEGKETIVSVWTLLLEIFGKDKLEEIVISGVAIFETIQPGQRRSLHTLLKRIRKGGDEYFKNVITIVLKMFTENDFNASFQNFVNLVKFISTYIGEQAADLNEQNIEATIDGKETADERIKRLRNDVARSIARDIKEILKTFKTLSDQIKTYMGTITPTFHSIVSAVYHYFKHKLIPHMGKILSIDQYFDFIQSLLKKLKKLPQFSDMTESNRELEFERYIEIYKRRFQIVVKIQGGDKELSSGYFQDEPVDGDRDGDEYLNGDKLDAETDTEDESD